MTKRLGLMALATVGVAIVVACGSSDSPEVAGPAANLDGSVTADGSQTPGDNPDGAPGPGAATCDPATAASCGNNRKCDPALGCVECAADADCTAAGRDPFCILGRCEACRTNTDCGVAAPSCFPGDHTCHRSCAVDGGSRCGGDTPICDQATGACIGCNANTDCPAGAPLCEPTTKSCVTCLTNTDCPAARPQCRPQRFECVECLKSADCGPGRVCTADNECRQGCTADKDCPDQGAPKCNTTTARCVACLGAGDCASVANRPICSFNGQCVQCQESSDCGDGGTPFCRNARCVECRNDNDCPGNGNCDNGTCH